MLFSNGTSLLSYCILLLSDSMMQLSDSSMLLSNGTALLSDDIALFSEGMVLFRAVTVLLSGSLIFCLLKKITNRQYLGNSTNPLSTFKSSPTCFFKDS